MKELIDIQIIKQGGKPAFAVLPWDIYESIRPTLEANKKKAETIPHAVVCRSFEHNTSILLAWREYLGLSQVHVAKKSGMQQSALSRIEKGESKPQAATLKRIAHAMGLNVEQLGF